MILTPAEEKQLVSDLKKQDQRAMRRLYDGYAALLMSIALRYVGDFDQAQDVLQESLIKIYNNMERFEYRGTGTFKAWMSRIVSNEAIAWLREQKRSALVFPDYDLPDNETVNADGDEPEVQLVPNEVLMKMIGSLPAGYRTILNLVVFESRSHKEIAEMLGISENTSASQFHRAKKALKTKIVDYLKKEE